MPRGNFFRVSSSSRPREANALLEHALVLLEAQDLGAQPPELAAQGVDVGDVLLDLGGGAAQGSRESSSLRELEIRGVDRTVYGKSTGLIPRTVGGCTMMGGVSALGNRELF